MDLRGDRGGGGLRRPGHRVLTIMLLVKEMPANTNRRTNAVDNLDIVLLVYSWTHPFLIPSKKSGEERMANYLCPVPIVLRTIKTVTAGVAGGES